jgi:transposase
VTCSLVIRSSLRRGVSKRRSVTSTRATSRAEAERRLETFLIAVDRAGLPAFDAFAKGIRSWRQELLAHFDEPTTNGYAEGVINKVKVITRRAYGLPTFASFRQRVVIACG